MSYLKPQTPIRQGDNYIYPLTTVDQIIMEDGSRLNTVFHHSIKTNAVLYASKWSETAPYTQTINIKESGINSDLNIDVNVIYSGNQNTDSLLNMNANYLTYTKIIGDNIVFYCLSKKPQTDIPIEIQGICNDTIAGIDNLDFKIIGGTIQPDTATENTIWVNTEHEITNYYFTSAQPEVLSEGEVWVCTGTLSAGAFNASKTGNLIVYPMSAKQMIEGVLTDVPAKTYQNGSWLDWSLYLYNSGDECISLTGGWVQEAYLYSSGITATTSPCTFQKNTDHIYLKKNGVGKGNILYAKNLIDISQYSTLYFDGVLNDGGNGQYKDRVRLCVWSSFGKYSTNNIVAQATGNTTSGCSINVSHLTGEHIIGFIVYGDASVTLRSLYLE